MRIIKPSIRRFDWEFVVGPWASRLTLSRSGSFGWNEGDGPIIRFIRKYWTGWHRWDVD